MTHQADDLNTNQEQSPDLDFESTQEAPQGDELSDSITKLTQNRDDILKEKRETASKNKTLTSENESLKAEVAELKGLLVSGEKNLAINSVLDAIHGDFKVHAKSTLENVVKHVEGKVVFMDGEKVVADSAQAFLEYAKTNTSWASVLKAPNTQGVGAQGGHSNGYQQSSSSKSTTVGSNFGIGK